MTKRIVILGAGFGGLETAHGLAALVSHGYEITLIDKSDAFFIGFSKIDVLFGRRTVDQVRYRYSDLEPSGVRFVQGAVTAIDTAARRVTTSGGTFDYDYLVIALGADLDHDATAGYRGAGGHDFYSLAGADRLRPVIEAFSSGTLVLGVLGVPYKCPPAPYEVACQLHAMFVARGVRDRVKLAMVIPSPRPVPNPNVSSALEKLLADRGIELRAGKPIRSIDGAAKHLVIGDGTLAYDLFVGVPVHVAPAVVRSSGLVDKGFLAVSSTNLETSIANVYAIGDVAAIPAGDIAVPKAGAFAEDAARTVVSDILMKEGRIAERQKFLGLGTCYAEVGDGMIAKITANFFGGETPQMALEGPSNAYDADKREFASSRRARWFR